MHPFSPAGRQAALQRLGRERLDLLVIGGGITGCGLAREAALHGLKVGLVEKIDFGCGTSSRSSKLVHGGLRYLAQGDLRMVRESLRERTVLRRIAPDLVQPIRFVYPLYRGQTHWPVKLAFRLIDRMAGATGEERHRLISPAEVLERAPGLGLPVDGGIEYLEFITDDARLTLANALSAALHGAVVANYAPVVGFRVSGGRLEGARVRDALTGQELEVSARVVVNAAGPWAEEVLGLGAGTEKLGRILLSKGIHLLFAAERLQVDGAVVLRSLAGQQGFAVRRGDCVYVGTTDVAHQGRPDRPVADSAAVAELLALVQSCFPDLGLGPQDVLATWAGLRPLIAQPGRPPRDTSRHDQIWRSPEGLITVAGGKLTTYRPTAKRIMRRMWAALGRKAPAGDPSAQVLLPAIAAVCSDVRVAVEQEMACTLLDFMDRRSAQMLFSCGDRAGAADEAAKIMAALLDWSDAERLSQVAEYLAVDAAHRLLHH